MKDKLFRATGISVGSGKKKQASGTLRGGVPLACSPAMFQKRSL